MMSVPAWVRDRAVAMGFKVPLAQDPLLWSVLAVAAGVATYQGVHKDGAWALFDFVVATWALGNLAGWARRRLSHSKEDGHLAGRLWVFRLPLTRDWLFGVCLLAAVASGLISRLVAASESVSAIAFSAILGFFQAALVLGLLRAFAEGYREG